MIMLLKATLPDMEDEEKRNTLYKFLKENRISAGQKKDYKEFDEPTLLIDMTRLYKFYWSQLTTLVEPMRYPDF